MSHPAILWDGTASVKPAHKDYSHELMADRLRAKLNNITILGQVVIMLTDGCGGRCTVLGRCCLCGVAAKC